MPERLSVLTMPGMGDIHWIALKLEALRDKMGRKAIDLWIWNADNKPRSREYVELVPFVDTVQYLELPHTADTDAWRAAVHDPGTELVTPFAISGKTWTGEFVDCEFDALFSVNGSTRYGRNLVRDVCPDLTCNFQYPLDEPEQSKAAAKLFRHTHGGYVLYYWNDLLMYKRDWLNHFPLTRIVETMREVHANTGYKAVLTGKTDAQGGWDHPFNQEIEKALDADWVVNICGQTDVADLFALIREASAFVGWCAGNTIMSTHIGTHTVMLWSDYFESRKFATCWADPQKVGKCYRPLFVEDISANTVVEHVLAGIHAPLA